jgi:NAD(P)-dependent dehydrogenase (short-subunit alcohol dehydrogenase family)
MTVDCLVILTGASRGLGQAMAAQYLAGGAFVLGLSRRPSTALAPTAAGGLEQWPVDLGDPLPVAERLGAWLADFGRRAGGQLPQRVRVIHNAALLSEPGNVAEGDPRDLAQSLRVGLEAPVALTAVFLRATALWSASDRRVLFVSSARPRARGARAPARRPRGLGGAGRHRHRHAEAAARRRPAALSRTRDVRRVPSQRRAGQPGRRRGQGDRAAGAGGLRREPGDRRPRLNRRYAVTLTGTRDASAHISS